jgi:TP901 family phage tail tape measure protein
MASDAITIDLEFRPTGTQQQFAKVGEQAKSAGQKASIKFSEGFSNNIKKSFAGVRSTIVKTAGAFLAFNTVKGVFNDATRSAIEFEKSLIEINTILPKNTKLTEQQTKALREYSKQFGTTSTAQAKSYYQIISAGVTDTAKANQLLASANKLAIGGLSDVGSSIDILTSIVNAYGQENITAQQAADSLFTAVRLGKTTISELSSSLASAIPSARSAGVELDVVNAAVATLTANGNSTSMAVTRLNALFTALAKNGKVLGEGFDITAVQNEGLITVLQRLEKRTGGSSEALLKLFGRVEAVQAAQTLMRDSAKVLSDTYGEFSNKLNATEKAFGQMGMSADQQFKILNAQWNDFKLTLGQGIVPVLLEITSKFKTIRAIAGDFLGGGKATTVAQDFKNRIDDTTLALADLHQKKRELMQEEQSGSGLIRGFFLPGRIKETNQAIMETTMQLAAMKRQRDAFAEGDANAQKKEELNLLRQAQGAYQSEMEAKALLEEQRLAQHQADIARKEEKAAAAEQLRLDNQSAQEMFSENTQSNFQNLVSYFGLAGKKVKNIARDISSVVFSSLTNGIGRAFQNVGKALASGENAFTAFADGLKSILGDIASSMGDVYIKWGVANIASQNYGVGGAQIAAGAGLKLLSGVLGASGGGGGGGGSRAGGSTVTEPITVDDSEINDQQETREQASERVQLNLNVEGSVVRDSELSGYVAELLEEGSNENATVIPTLKTGI